MNRWVAITGSLLFSIATGVFGYSYGLRQGWQLGLMADAAPRAVIAVSNLKALQKGNTEPINLFLETDVDMGIFWSYHLRQHPLANYFEPIWGLNAFTTNDEYLVRLAKYRKVNPSPFKVDAFDVAPKADDDSKEFYADLAMQSRENARIIEEVVMRYGSK
jgi:hypothetical protein